MTSITNTFITARAALSSPWRKRRLRELSMLGQSPLIALFYHRVADTNPNPWTISCSEFQRHVDYCHEHTDVISLQEMQQRIQRRFNDKLATAFTFDDGYAENCRFAIPYLMKTKTPCVYFVTLDHLLTQKPFAHDVKRGTPLPVNTLDEIKAMVDGGIEIGLHARTHIDFSRPASARVIQSEVTEAVAELSDLIGRRINYFAFPYGLRQHLSPEVIHAIRDAGLQGFCSAYGAYNFPDGDAYHLRRVHGDPSFVKFQNWLSFDERKVRIEDRLATVEKANQTPKRPLRTLFVITSMPVGGAETLLVNLMDRFDPARIQPEVVCLKEPGPLGEKIQDRHPVHSGLLSRKLDLRVLPRLASLFFSRTTDAVITVGAGDKMFWGRLAAKLANVPVICSALHSTGWPDGVGKLNRWLTPITDGFIAVAGHHGEHLSKYEGFPSDRVHIIRNGVDCQRFRPDPRAEEALRTELGLPLTTKLVGIVAALRPEKNHRMFVEVAAHVVKERSDVHFIIVGDGPERPTIEAKIAELGVQTQVHLLGTRHDTPAIVAALDLFLLCSHNEASPVSILEALACGVPVISTDVGSVAESVVDGQTGYLVKPDQHKLMADLALELLANDEVARKMGEAGRELVLETGSLDAMVEGYTTLIETLYRIKRAPMLDAAPETAPVLVQNQSATIRAMQEVH